MRKTILLFLFIITALSMHAQTRSHASKVVNDTLMRIQQTAKPVTDTGFKSKSFIQYLVQHSKVAAVIAGIFNKNQ